MICFITQRYHDYERKSRICWIILHDITAFLGGKITVITFYRNYRITLPPNAVITAVMTSLYSRHSLSITTSTSNTLRSPPPKEGKNKKPPPIQELNPKLKEKVYHIKSKGRQTLLNRPYTPNGGTRRTCSKCLLNKFCKSVFRFWNRFCDRIEHEDIA